jgi:hypothetical protein
MSPDERRPRILLGHLAAFGDCLCATTVARQIRQDYPLCHLTWAVATPYRTIVEGNPDVDEIWEIPFGRTEATSMAGWKSFVRQARAERRRGKFDLLFFTQVPPANYHRFDGTVRASVLRGYPGAITVPLAPVVRLTEKEAGEARAFAERHRLAEGKRVVLFECAAFSGQSFVTPDFALATARELTRRLDDCTVLLSSSTAIPSGDPRIIDGSTLTFKANAELTKYADLFVGAYSGITWLALSDWARRIPMIQLARRAAGVFGSLALDAEYFTLPSDQLLEMTDSPPERVAEVIEASLRGPFAEARRKFHQPAPPDLSFYFNTFLLSLLKGRHPIMAAGSLRTVIRRYGWGAVGRTLRGLFDRL